MPACSSFAIDIKNPRFGACHCGYTKIEHDLEGDASRLKSKKPGIAFPKINNPPKPNNGIAPAFENDAKRMQYPTSASLRTTAPYRATKTPPVLFKAICSFQTSKKDCLAFSEGDVIEVLDSNDKHWWKGKIKENVGIFPPSFVVAVEKASHQTNSKKPSTQLFTPKFPQSKTLMYPDISPKSQTSPVSKHEYMPSGNGKYRPAVAFRLPDYPQNLNHSKAHIVSEAKIVFANFDLSGSVDDDLSFKAGDYIRVLSRVNDEWSLGQLVMNAEGHLIDSKFAKTGIFPNNFVRKVSERDFPDSLFAYLQKENYRAIPETDAILTSSSEEYPALDQAQDNSFCVTSSIPVAELASGSQCLASSTYESPYSRSSKTLSNVPPQPPTSLPPRPPTSLPPRPPTSSPPQPPRSQPLRHPSSQPPIPLNCQPLQTQSIRSSQSDELTTNQVDDQPVIIRPGESSGTIKFSPGKNSAPPPPWYKLGDTYSAKIKRLTMGTLTGTYNHGKVFTYDITKQDRTRVTLEIMYSEGKPLSNYKANVVPFNPPSQSVLKLVADVYGPRIIAYGLWMLGKVDGNGECWTLCDSAFKSACCCSPVGKNFGASVPLHSASRGDVIHMTECIFRTPTQVRRAGSPDHFVIIYKMLSPQKCIVLEQNPNPVNFAEYDFSTMTSGKFQVYRCLAPKSLDLETVGKLTEENENWAPKGFKEAKGKGGAVAVAPFNATAPDDLGFAVGQKIDVKNVYDEWCTGVIYPVRYGKFPKNHVRFLV